MLELYSKFAWGKGEGWEGEEVWRRGWKEKMNFNLVWRGEWRWEGSLNARAISLQLMETSLSSLLSSSSFLIISFIFSICLSLHPFMHLFIYLFIYLVSLNNNCK